MIMNSYTGNPIASSVLKQGFVECDKVYTRRRTRKMSQEIQSSLQQIDVEPVQETPDIQVEKYSELRKTKKNKRKKVVSIVEFPQPDDGGFIFINRI
jgi:hypothetical protein